MGHRVLIGGITFRSLFVEWLLKSAPFQGSTEISQLMAIFSVLGSEATLPDWSDCPTLAASPWSRWIHPPKDYQPRILEKKLKEMGLSQLGCELAASLLEMEPTQRISAKAALQHPFFLEEPFPASPDE